MQRALLQFKNPKNYNIVYDALVKAGREDLIGNGPKCLIRDKNSFGKGNNHSNHKSGGRKSRNENSGRRESEDKKRSSHSKKQRGNKSDKGEEILKSLVNENILEVKDSIEK